ncbi:glycosyltransferase, exosortase A system-associated [Candidatus Berkiella cookevillensis]|uniref:GDP-mannose-dependent alpha-(1-6)-phosphatidylinositol monomannoside mannosyltransferase n=1 Tax=Candidatus Berkiella cookevillensis TaxID=437022 RepID=A0A0Q9YMT3_9GAMM|nr:TIGR04063 family PEP-CTERM/XrtA system glycosyltransferase [Candidatus Berkiella cookevillensis]MCS5709129.1 glycosyltransferase, exosortase A system-associated [Candidatus Berkiella cookevillensis]
MSTKKILHLFDHSIPLQSGYSFRSRAILMQQKQMGYEVKAITSNRQGKTAHNQESIDGIEFYRSDMGEHSFYRFPIVKQIETIMSLRTKIKAVVEDWWPDVIHSHSPVLSALAALSICRHYHIPLVYEIRAFWEDAAVDYGTHSELGLRYRLIKYLETKVCMQANHITTICDGLKNDLLSRGISNNKITVIPNAVDLSKFTQVALISKNKHGIAQKYQLQNGFVIGFIGSLYAYEGLDVAIEAFRSIKSVIPNAKLLIVGDGPQLEVWRRIAQTNKFANDIIFTGKVPHNEVKMFYEIIDVLVYPRKKMRLTDLVTPLKPLEAMAMGKGVVASDVGGHKELIRNRENGLLFRAEDAQDFKNKIIEISNKKLRESLVARGLKFVTLERNWPNSVKRYENVYEQCI